MADKFEPYDPMRPIGVKVIHEVYCSRCQRKMKKQGNRLVCSYCGENFEELPEDAIWRIE